jgi:hypothetical protein
MKDEKLRTWSNESFFSFDLKIVTQAVQKDIEK